MSKSLFLTLACFVVPSNSTGAEEPKDPYADVIKKVEARFEPTEARPGQSVILKIELRIAKGWITYPTKQPDLRAQDCVNRIAFPKDGLVTFTGKIKEPENPTIRDEPIAFIKDLHSYPGGGIWECEAVISPKAPPGPQTVKVQFRPRIHNEENCGPRKLFEFQAMIKVVGEPIKEKK